ncbi:hypothetical protein Trydic_g13208 [Trypoxylus dichotomus]
MAWEIPRPQSFKRLCFRFHQRDEVTNFIRKVQTASIGGSIRNDKNSEEFNFRLVALEGDTVRLTVQDLENSRYTPQEDALDGVPPESSFSLLSRDDNLISLGVGENIVVHLYINPFKIEVYEDEQNVITVNKNNRLIINTDEDDKSLALDFSFPLAQRAYGIPQHAERLSLPSTGPNGLSAFRMFNVDYYGYQPFTREALYGSIGVLYGISTEITSGIFWMNGAQTFVDIDNRVDGVDALFISETGALELFLFGGPTLKDCVRQFTALTGVAELPQYFTLGYHQSRYSYMSQEDVETVVAEFDNHDFPMDTIWLDIDYTDGYRYFTWNSTSFPDPIAMQNKIVETGRKAVAIIDPHIKVEEGYFVYDQALANDYFVKHPNGTVFEGLCWPDLSSYIEFFDKDAQQWYGDLYLLDNFENTTLNLYIWNDMNEPSVFEALDQTMPADLQHAGGWEHRDVHNLYGMKHIEATKGGLLRRDPNRRPFVLTRAHFAGSQRYAAMWTGDNSPTWDHLRISIPMVLTESLAGMAFCGADVGGFTGNVAEDLLQRWYQAGAWYPFFRGHSGIDTDRREPYLFSSEIQGRVREAIRTRYRHLPYWYTVFFEHERTGDPIVRPLSYQYPKDASVLDIDSQWLIGTDIMAAPVIYEGVKGITTYFPGGPNEYWYNLVDMLVYNGIGNFPISVTMDTAPYYYRGGSIIFRIDENVRHTQDQHDAAYDLYVCADANGEATGTFYLDDLESFAYKNKAYHYYRFIYRDNKLSVEQIDEDTDFETSFSIGKIHLYRVTSRSRNGIGKANRITINKKITLGNMKRKSKIDISLL